MKGACVTEGFSGWVDGLGGLVPGSHVAVLTDRMGVGVEGRLAGLELRDTLLVLRVGPVAGLVFLFRKPLALGTVVSQVLSTGTGGLNLDGCRVSTGGEVLSVSTSDPFHKADGTQLWNATSSGAIERGQHVAGRWPPNVLLVHGPGCVPLGTRSVKGSGPTASGFDRYNRANATQGYRPGEYQRGPVAAPASRLGEDGLESVPVWQCEPGCPVGLLDGQSGSISASFRPGNRMVQHEDGVIIGRFPTRSEGAERTGIGYGDSGGASRFYPQFGSEVDLRAWLTRLVGG